MNPQHSQWDEYYRQYREWYDRYGGPNDPPYPLPPGGPGPGPHGPMPGPDPRRWGDEAMPPWAGPRGRSPPREKPRYPDEYRKESHLKVNTYIYFFGFISIMPEVNINIGGYL